MRMMRTANRGRKRTGFNDMTNLFLSACLLVCGVKRIVGGTTNSLARNVFQLSCSTHCPHRNLLRGALQLAPVQLIDFSIVHPIPVLDIFSPFAFYFIRITLLALTPFTTTKHKQKRIHTICISKTSYFPEKRHMAFSWWFKFASSPRTDRI